MKKLFALLILAVLTIPMAAQRVTDKLNRGLIAQKTTSGVFLSWRILGEEYYDVAYNVYRDGVKINETPLLVSNFTDKAGTLTSTYTVSPVVKGVEKQQSKAASVWKNSYMEIVPKHDSSIKSTLIPNDACCADVDGDGEVEILLKYDNQDEMGQSYPKNGPAFNGVASKEYSIFECLKLDGTVLWWVNCGPNMGDFQNNEQNIVGYDWNCDGKAEVVMRLLEGSSIHYADGTVYTIGADGKNGTAWTNYRGATGGGTNWFMHDGKEFLVYCNGQTGNILDIINFPLARLEPGETDLNAAWGDGYGHRCSKFFFGAPYLDGKKPSIFLARGIYTQIKMCAYDVNPATNKLVKRWDWRQTNGGYWMWQGYHNFGVADVDMDGRDEICYGSMVIDDNGKGLSTTGLGHGDAQHCGDFNPYIHGLEIYACNEDQPGNNYRDATTSKIYHRFNSGNDDGRAMAGNFTNAFPGGQACSAREGLISLVYNDPVPGLDGAGVNTNFRIYWDGDLLEETFNYRNGKNTEGVVAKYGSWSPIYTCEGSMTNNDTKGTPCYQGDVLGDWREEIIMRTASNNIRIYSTPTATAYRNYTLWHDHQYRNAMVWQMCGYNQPPHVSYFLGDLEGITIAPPPLTMTDREEVANGGSVTSALNGKHAIVCETGNSAVSIVDGASPSVLTINVPSWVQGTAGTNYTAKDAKINYTYYTCDVTGGGLAGDGRLVKQGDGILNLPKADFKHSGETNIWEGTVNFDGTMKNSPLWLNRFTKLNSNGGQFKSIKADYAAEIRPGGENTVGMITVDETLTLDYGSHLIIDIKGTDCDKIKAAKISTVKKTGDKWTKYGPEFVQPVIEVVGTDIQAGEYVIAECAELDGSITNFKVKDVEGLKAGLKYEDGKIILVLGGTRGATNILWTGANGSAWNYATAENFVIADDAEQTPEVFVNGDFVEFNDNAKVFSVNVAENLSVDTIKVANTKAYTFTGDGSIVSGAFVKEGTGTVTMNGKNSYTGGNYIRGGVVVVNSLANDVSATGSLGGVTTTAAKFVLSNGATLQNSASVKNGSPIKVEGDAGGIINNASAFDQQKMVTGTLLTKKGAGTLSFSVSNTSLKKLVIAGGTVNGGSTPAALVEMQSGTLNLGGGSAPIDVPKGRTATVNFSDRTGAYNNRLTGAGTVNVWHTTANGNVNYAIRTQINGNWSAFEGTVKPSGVDGRFVFNNNYGLPKATVNIASGVTVKNVGNTFAIGKVTGDGVLGGSESLTQSGRAAWATWNVGCDEDFTFAGTAGDNAKVNKVGTGIMTVSGTWTNTGAVAIQAGTIKLGTAGTLGTGALTINEGAVLHRASTGTASTAALKNSSVTVNGTLYPRLSASGASGVILFNGQNVTINPKGKLAVAVSKASTSATTMSGSYIMNVGTLTINGTIEVEFKYVPNVGDQIRVWKGVTKFAGTPKVVVLPLDDGTVVELDASHYSEGYLEVKDVVATGIDNIAANETVTVEAYAANGGKAATFTATLETLDNDLNQQAIPAGAYVLRVKARKNVVTIKKIKK